MKKIIKKITFFLICLTYGFVAMPVFAFAQVNCNLDLIESINGVKLNSSKNKETRDIKELKKSNSRSNAPIITGMNISGDVDKTKTGPDFFRNIKIELVGENLTDDNFLTEKGFHWSNKTYVELIKGREKGYAAKNIFGASNTPTVPVKLYSINNGDSGRINYVGRTKSGIDLDLIWTVVASNKEDWISHSGYGYSPHDKGLGFSGAQYVPNSKGNSIVVLYNQADTLSLQYSIVRHGTNKKQPVVVSFISADIDAAQGVRTNLANLVELIPEESNLKKADEIIYDGSTTFQSLNGESDLPKGGYLGAGFLASFTYTFYSPAPKMAHYFYDYALSVRYDIFGSSLQANVETKVVQRIHLEYLDDEGNNIKDSEIFSGFTDESYDIDFLEIEGYKLVDVDYNFDDIYNPVIKFIYKPEYKINLNFLDSEGNEILESKEFVVLKGEFLKYEIKEIEGYEKPEDFELEVFENGSYDLIYKKIEIPVSENNKGSNKSKDKNIKKNNVPDTKNNKEVLKDNNQDINRFIVGGSISKKEIDAFMENTGMNAEQKKLFLDYLDFLYVKAKEKYGNDINKINHFIANGICYSVYGKDIKQKAVNDFGDVDECLDDFHESIQLKELLKDIYQGEEYKIDFPHLAMPIATAEGSGAMKEFFKMILSNPISPSLSSELSYKEIFFQLNSLMGDNLSYIDDKDLASDIDAYILYFHPDFKNIPLHQRIFKYYSIKNLDDKRSKFYDEAVTIMAEKNNLDKEDYKEQINVLAAFALGGIAIATIVKVKKEFEKVKTVVGQTVKIFKKVVVGAVNTVQNFIARKVDVAISKTKASIDPKRSSNGHKGKGSKKSGKTNERQGGQTDGYSSKNNKKSKSKSGSKTEPKKKHKSGRRDVLPNGRGHRGAPHERQKYGRK